MSAFKYEQNVVDGVEVSEVWGLDTAGDHPNAPATPENKAAIIKEWITRHADRAKAQRFTKMELTPDPEDAGHFVFKAWP